VRRSSFPANDPQSRQLVLHSFRRRRQRNRRTFNASQRCPTGPQRISLALFFCNAKQGNTFGPRNPIWIAVGRETLDARQPVTFGERVSLQFMVAWALRMKIRYVANELDP